MQGKEITTEDGTTRLPNLDDVMFYYKVPAGAVVQEDLSCNSTFMHQTMPTIGASICEKMQWVLQNIPIHLVINEAGEHGMNIP